MSKQRDRIEIARLEYRADDGSIVGSAELTPNGCWEVCAGETMPQSTAAETVEDARTCLEAACMAWLAYQQAQRRVSQAFSDRMEHITSRVGVTARTLPPDDEDGGHPQ